jgi:putative tryptophan/tyrosine transport system substrate-binding protein
MRRRDFIALGAASATSWPVVSSATSAHAQQRSVPTIGFIRTTTPQESAWLVAAVKKGLSETGYIEGHNVAIEYRYAQNQYERLPDIAADLVRQNVALIVATGGTVAALAAKRATSKIPIVFTTGDDAVKVGLVASYNRPGGNLTGVSVVSGELAGKRLELLRTLIPKISTVAVLVNPNNPNVQSDTAEVQSAAPALGLRLAITQARTPSEIDQAFTRFANERPDALYVSVDTFFTVQRGQITALATRHAIPAVYVYREFTAAGGLMSYGVDWADVYRQAGVYAARVLKGANPADLPVMLPSKFPFVLNLSTAKALGLNVPPALLASADEVIE